MIKTSSLISEDGKLYFVDCFRNTYLTSDEILQCLNALQGKIGYVFAGLQSHNLKLFNCSQWSATGYYLVDSNHESRLIPDHNEAMLNEVLTSFSWSDYDNKLLKAENQTLKADIQALHAENNDLHDVIRQLNAKIDSASKVYDDENLIKNILTCLAHYK